MDLMCHTCHFQGLTKNQMIEKLNDSIDLTLGSHGYLAILIVQN